MLPNVEPDFKTMSDIDLVGLVAYCEKWSLKDVYNTAYAQVFPKKQVEGHAIMALISITGVIIMLVIMSLLAS